MYITLYITLYLILYLSILFLSYSISFYLFIFLSITLYYFASLFYFILSLEISFHYIYFIIITVFYIKKCILFKKMNTKKAFFYFLPLLILIVLKYNSIFYSTYSIYSLSDYLDYNSFSISASSSILPTSLQYLYYKSKNINYNNENFFDSCKKIFYNDYISKSSFSITKKNQLEDLLLIPSLSIASTSSFSYTNTPFSASSITSDSSIDNFIFYFDKFDSSFRGNHWYHICQYFISQRKLFKKKIQAFRKNLNFRNETVIDKKKFNIIFIIEEQKLFNRLNYFTYYLLLLTIYDKNLNNFFVSTLLSNNELKNSFFLSFSNSITTFSSISLKYLNFFPFSWITSYFSDLVPLYYISNNSYPFIIFKQPQMENLVNTKKIFLLKLSKFFYSNNNKELLYKKKETFLLLSGYLIDKIKLIPYETENWFESRKDVEDLRNVTSLICNSIVKNNTNYFTEEKILYDVKEYQIQNQISIEFFQEKNEECKEENNNENELKNLEDLKELVRINSFFIITSIKLDNSRKFLIHNNNINKNILKNSFNILIYERNDTRKILNIYQLIQNILLNNNYFNIYSSSSFPNEFFDSYNIIFIKHDEIFSPCDLTYIFKNTHILISSHGFQLSTLFLFEKLIKIIEIFPSLYFKNSYIKLLSSKQVNNEEINDTVSDSSNDDNKIINLYNQTILHYYFQKTININQSLFKYTNLRDCMESKKCRSFSRNQNIILDHQEINAISSIISLQQFNL